MFLCSCVAWCLCPSGLGPHYRMASDMEKLSLLCSCVFHLVERNTSCFEWYLHPHSVCGRFIRSNGLTYLIEAAYMAPAVAPLANTESSRRHRDIEIYGRVSGLTCRCSSAGNDVILSGNLAPLRRKSTGSLLARLNVRPWMPQWLPSEPHISLSLLSAPTQVFHDLSPSLM